MRAFSIIIPVYNVEKYIRQCLESIQNQSFQDYEVLIVDDCGNDNSIEIAKEFAQKDSRFKIFHHEYNKGVSAARNTALNNATGKYIVFVDPDDWIENKLLEMSISVFGEIPNIDAIWINTQGYNNETHELEYKDSININDNGLCNIDLNDEKGKNIIGCIWNKIYKKENIDKINLRFPINLITEDDEFTYKYFATYHSVYVLHQILYTYRQLRQNSYTNITNNTNFIIQRSKIFLNMYNFSIEQGIFNANKKFLLNKFTYITNLLKDTHDRKALKQIQEVMEYIGFPENFAELDNYKNKLNIGIE